MADSGDKSEEVEQKNAENLVKNGTDPVENIREQGEEIEEQPVREITQTDHLNKRLLDSFLQRINQATAEVPHVERIPTSDSGDDFDIEPDQSNKDKPQ